MNILVTGGAGFIGSHLVDALVEQGHRVRVLDSQVPQVHGSAVLTYVNPRAEFIPGDAGDREILSRALDGIEAVFHQAAEVGVGQSMYEVERYVRANTYATAILLEFLVQSKRKIRRLVVASSMSIYGEGAYRCAACGPATPEIRPPAQLAAHRWEHLCPQCGAALQPIGTPESKPLFPTSVYAITKQDQEQLCLTLGRAYGIPTIALRYFNVYGTRQTLSNPYTGVCAIFSSRLLNDHPPLIFEDGRQSRDFVHVSDIVQANLLALKSDASLYRALNVGTGIPTSVLDLAKLLSDGLGKKIASQIVGKYREGDIRHCVADISLAGKLLGFAPKVGLTQGLAELVNWVRTQSPSDRVDEATAALAARNLVH